MFVIQARGKINIIKIDRAEQFEDFNIPGCSYLVKGESDLAKVPTVNLIGIYNQANKQNPVTKFSDRATAEKRVWPIIAAVNGNEAKHKVAASEPAEPKAPKVKKEKKPGIIFTIFTACEMPDGASLEELKALLKESFPEKNIDAMVRTARLNIKFKVNRDLHPNYLPGRHFEKRKIEGRGTVYFIKKD